MVRRHPLHANDCGLRKELRHMSTRIGARLAGSSERGFTLIELLVVIIVIGILLAIAVPSYIGFRDRAANNEVKENLRGALPAAQAYHDDNGTYAGMTESELLAIDSGLSESLAVAAADESTFCLTDTVNGRTWSVLGPSPASSTGFVANADCAGAS
jgi:type IV pilus assembly protein PilA